MKFLVHITNLLICGNILPAISPTTPSILTLTLGLKSTQKDTKGFFIEAGAVDGEYLSNTLLFEMKYDWTGLLVEPNPAQLKELYTKHRKAYILPHCLSTKTEVEIVTFEVSDVLSGIMLDGKVRPSRIDDPNPGRSDKKYERKIQVLNLKTKSI